MEDNIHSSEILIKAFEFEKLCAKIFKAKGLLVETNVYVDKMGKNDEIDLILTNSNGKQTVAEIKYYRTRKPSKTMLEKAVKRIKAVSERISIRNQMLILGTPIDNKLKKDLLTNYNIKIVDSNNLLFLIGDNETLLNEFYYLISDTPIEAQDELKAEEVNLNYLFEDNLNTGFIEEPIMDNTEARLWSELESINCGRSSFTKYEDKCTEILKHLFDENLNGWNKQERTDNGLNRYDLICRAKKGNEFWEFLIYEFHSRYILFEFKNYCEEVKQTQVYTTEKYLFQKALRNICFMISRKGLDKNALTATKGILRESGKLIVDLKDEDIYKMLKLKEAGDEPSDYLFEKVDEILLKLSK